MDIHTLKFDESVNLKNKLISRFKDQDAILKIVQKLIELEKKSPERFDNVCDFIEYTYEKARSKSIPDITA